MVEKTDRRFDVQAVSFDSLDWSENKKTESLTTVFSLAEQHAKTVIDWYLLSKKSKKQCAQILRIAIILLTTLAAVIPILSEKITGLSPVWATFVLALAAMCVALDRYFGCSNAWIRYITAEHKVRQRLHVFQIEREQCKVNWENGSPNKEQLLIALDLAKKCFIDVDDIVHVETEQWRAEFQNIIKELDIAANNKQN